MAKQETIPFPSDLSLATPEGIVALGGSMIPENLIAAYARGIFPWPLAEGAPVPWFCPPERGILRFENIHVSRSLKRFLAKNPYRVSINQSFRKVVENCASVPRPTHSGGNETWITNEVVHAYDQLHRKGYAHSVETWHEDRLVGGIYGVGVQGVFGAESMFYLEPNASQVALLELVSRLQKAGLSWMDIQMVTPHLEKLGGELICRDEFLTLLQATQDPARKLF